MSSLVEEIDGTASLTFNSDNGERWTVSVSRDGEYLVISGPGLTLAVQVPSKAVWRKLSELLWH